MVTPRYLRGLMLPEISQLSVERVQGNQISNNVLSYVSTELLYIELLECGLVVRLYWGAGC